MTARRPATPRPTGCSDAPDVPPGAAAALRARAERSDYTDLLTRVSVPTLVVVGRDDEFTPVAAAEFMVRLIPGRRW